MTLPTIIDRASALHYYLTPCGTRSDSRSAWPVYTQTRSSLLLRDWLSNNNRQYNFALPYSLCCSMKMNYKASAQSMFQWSFYNTVMQVLSFNSPFEIFSCFILGKCTVSWPQANKPDEWSKGPSHLDQLVVIVILGLFSLYGQLMGL